MSHRGKLRPLTFAVATPFLLAPFGALNAQALRIYTVEPCRILDTRIAGNSVGGELGGQTDIDSTPSYHGPLAPSQTINIDVTSIVTQAGILSRIAGQGGAADCGVPFPDAKGVFINVTAVEPTGASNNHLTVYPYNRPLPTAATLSYEPGVFAISNAILVPLCTAFSPPGGCDDDLSITNGPSASTQVVIDVTGYAQ
jgi:hypothetical protein